MTMSKEKLTEIIKEMLDKIVESKLTVSNK